MSIISIYNEFLKIENHLDFVCRPASQPASQPAVRPGSARCRAPEIQHSKDYSGALTKLLFRRRFIHCAMVVLLYFLSSLSIGMRIYNFSVTTTFHTRCKQVRTIMRACHFIVTNRFVHECCMFLRCCQREYCVTA